MHAFWIAAALGLTLTGLPPGWAQDESPSGVTVPDAALRAVLEDSLDLSAGDPIPAASLSKLTVLEATDMGIVDLTGLEHATGLTRLDLGPGAMLDPWANTNAVSDLSPLSGLTALTYLDLAGNSVVDVTPLAGLTGLRWLNLEVNFISDFSSLRRGLKLRDVYIAYNPVMYEDPVPEAAAGDATTEVLPSGVILEAGQIDSSKVRVGASVAVVYGLGFRNPVSGEWLKLTTARGKVQAVDGQRLLLAVEDDRQSQRIDMERIQTLVLGGRSLSPLGEPGTIQDQTEPLDSLTVREAPPTWDREDNWSSGPPVWFHHRALRLPAKVGAGLLSGLVVSALAMGYADATVERNPQNTHRGVGLVLGGAVFGCSVGFPLGVSALDPQDSLPITLLAGVMPGLTGYFLLRTDQENAGIGFPLMYIGPLVGSLVASELWRKPPKDRRVSFGLSPTLDDGLSAYTTLHF